MEVVGCTCDGVGPECLSCYHHRRTARERFEAELARARKHTKDKKMSADWLHDDKDQPIPVGAGYHLKKFDKGVYGESSKILEEVQELQDAEAQDARIMALHELSDIIGAVYGYKEKHFPDIKWEDLIKMTNITRRAFETGHRK